MSEPTRARPSVAVTVDPKRCQGTGYCEQLAATIFRIGDGGVARVVGAVCTALELELVREAEGICPTRAILVEVATQEI